MLPTLRIRSKSHVYPVYLGSDLLGEIGSLLRDQPFARTSNACAIITDKTVAGLYAQTVQDALATAGFVPTLLTIPAGEGSKSLTEIGGLAERLAEASVDRHAFVVALGGGVVGDLAGFLASIYYRGIPFVQVPTTVVAQVDSAVGGKTGVNLRAGKNLLGTFYPPAMVLADVSTLASLPARARALHGAIAR